MTPDELRADIVATRAELADTADALAAKLEEKARVGKRIAVAIAGAAIVVVVVNRLRQSRRSK
jgi:Protein of unknown function (DUF3618)